MSNSVLSLLVALVSVSAIAIPAIVSVFRSQTSDIRVTVIRSREHETVKNYIPEKKFDFQLYVANVGNRRGAIGRVQMRPLGAGNESWEDLDFTPTYAEEMDEMIEPGTATFLYYSRASLFAPGALRNRPLPANVELKVEVISEDATREFVEIGVETGRTPETINQSQDTAKNRPVSDGPSLPSTEQTVIAIIAKQFDIEPTYQVTTTTDLVAELGCDDLDFVEVMMALEETFQINITDDELRAKGLLGSRDDKLPSALTIGQLVDLVRRTE